MSNFTTATPTLNQCYNDSQTYGAWPLAIYFKTGATTAATGAASGYASVQRLGSITVPAVTAPTTGFCFPAFDAVGGVSGIIVAGLEYTLGTLTVSGNSYADGVAMPTKTVAGVSTQTGASLVLAYVSTVLASETTPVLTMNYTNQAGTTGRSTSLTLPSNPAVNSCFNFGGSLQSGDTGVQDLSASGPNGLSISPSSGTGVIKLIGILPLGYAMNNTTTNTGVAIDILDSVYPIYKAEAAETIGFYYFGTAAANDVTIFMTGTPEQ